MSKGIDGRFRSGTLAGKSANIKWYEKKEGLLDIREDALPDFCLVLTGPQTKVLHSRGEDRPWLIDFVFLFEAAPLVDSLRRKRLKLGVATSVAQNHWSEAEVFPTARNALLRLSSEEKSLLGLFGTSGEAG